MRKPTFFIIGAPRCGTTSLASYLEQHPQIFFSDPKEPVFFNTDLRHYYRRSLEGYEQLFEEASDFHIAVGEGSASYLYSHVAVPNILRYNKNAKFIVMLRSPIDMAPSFHAHLLYHGNESVANFRDAWYLQEARTRGEAISFRCAEPKLLLYSKVCAMGEQLERLYQVVPRERVLLVFFEDFLAKTRDIYFRTLDFLEVPPNGRTDFQALNENKVRRSALLGEALIYGAKVRELLGLRSTFGFGRLLHRINSRRVRRQPLPDEFKHELVEHFRPDIKKLATLSGRDLSAWLRI